MRVRVEVVDRPLNLRGPSYRVGERLYLDTDHPGHRTALELGWVRRVDDKAADPVLSPAPPVVAAFAAPPANKMIETPDLAKSGAWRKPQKGK